MHTFILLPLLRCCNTSQGDVSAIPQHFNTAWHSDALAAVELTERGMGGRTARAVGLNYGMVKLIAQFMAHKLLPWLVPKPGLMTLNDTQQRYVC